MSVGVRRNSVCGPGCADIVAVSDGMQKPMLSPALTPAFSGEVFLLRRSQHLRQLGISAVIRQDEHHRVIRLAVARNWGIWRRLPPMRPRLQPENDRRDAAPLGGSEQKARDCRSGLGDAAIKVITETLAQRFRGATDDLGDAVLWDTDTRQIAHPLAHRIIYSKCFSSHRWTPVDLGP